MKSGKFRGDIQEIGLDPFYVFFCTDLQSRWYNTEFTRNRAVIAIDATGMGFRKLKSSNPKPTLLYTICARGNMI